MVIKNETVITKEMIKAVMRASNFDNNKYKTFKMIYNVFGLIFGMMFVSSLVPLLIGEPGVDYFIIVLHACACAIFLYIGMYGMDKNNYNRFKQIYLNMVGHTFKYEIDSEEIKVTDDDGDSDILLWKEVIKWNEDVENYYVFSSPEEALIISKKGFTECTSKDFKELATAIIMVRKDEENASTNDKNDEEQNIKND